MAADLATFLQEEVGAHAEEEEEDEYADVDWCDPDELGEEAQDTPAASSPAAPAGAATGASETPPTSTGEAKAKETKLPKASKDSEEAKRLRREAVLQHRVLSLCCVARLVWLNGMCNQELLQSSLLSLAPDCLKGGVGGALQHLKTRLLAPSDAGTGKDGEVQPSLVRLLRALQGFSADLSAEEWVLLLVARCRAEGRPSRLALRCPLPPAKSCLGLLRKPEEEAGQLQLWAEIFDPKAQRWRGLVPQADRRAPGEALWVLAMGPLNDLWDVTRRYARWSVVSQARGSLAKPWEEILRRFRWPETLKEFPGLQEANAFDEKRLGELASQEPLPNSRVGFRHHRLYVLNSQLKQSQIVQSTSPVGLFQGKDPIWRREDVKELLTASKWRQQGRVIRTGERPMKVLRSNSLFSSQLFGLWQTEEHSESFEDRARDFMPGFGPIPTTNNYGNIEVKNGLPKGTVHLTDDGVKEAALKLGVEFAPAVTGFQSERGVLKPTISGCVVWERDVEDVLRAAEEERDRLEQVKEAQKRERLKGAWQLLVKHVLLDLYVEQRYGSGGPS